MKIKVIAIIIFFISFGVTAFSQTLKVTGVDANLDRLYQSLAKKSLGKTMVLKVYDNSVIVKIGNLQEEILKQVSPGSYSKIIKDTETETETHSLTINTTLSVVTSAEFTITIQENIRQRRMARGTITAKRF